MALAINVAGRSFFYLCRWGLGTDSDAVESQGEYTEDQKRCADAESGSKGDKRTKGKLIRLNDLISKQDVKGGHQVLFGLTETTNEKQPKLSNDSPRPHRMV